MRRPGRAAALRARRNRRDRPDAACPQRASRLPSNVFLRPRAEAWIFLLIGSAFSVSGMLMLALAAATQAPGEKIGLALPVAFHVLNSIGFAHMLPVSLALFARMAPPALNATVIGLYYLAFFAGNALVGWIGGFFSTMEPTAFWLLHAALAGDAGLGFLLFRLTVWNRSGAGKGLPEPAPAP